MKESAECLNESSSHPLSMIWGEKTQYLESEDDPNLLIKLPFRSGNALHNAPSLCAQQEGLSVCCAGSRCASRAFESTQMLRTARRHRRKEGRHTRVCCAYALQIIKCMCVCSIKIFRDQPSLGFSEAESDTPTEQLALTTEQLGTVVSRVGIHTKPSGALHCTCFFCVCVCVRVYACVLCVYAQRPLRAPRFTNVTQICVFVEDNHGADTTRINKLELLGQSDRQTDRQRANQPPLWIHRVHVSYVLCRQCAQGHGHEGVDAQAERGRANRTRTLT